MLPAMAGFVSRYSLDAQCTNEEEEKELHKINKATKYTIVV